MNRNRIGGRTIRLGSIWIETVTMDGRLESLSIWRNRGQVLVRRWEKN